MGFGDSRDVWFGDARKVPLLALLGGTAFLIVAVVGSWVALNHARLAAENRAAVVEFEKEREREQEHQRIAAMEAERRRIAEAKNELMGRVEEAKKGLRSGAYGDCGVLSAVPNNDPEKVALARVVLGRQLTISSMQLNDCARSTIKFLMDFDASQWGAYPLYAPAHFNHDGIFDVLVSDKIRTLRGGFQANVLVTQWELCATKKMCDDLQEFMVKWGRAPTIVSYDVSVKLSGVTFLNYDRAILDYTISSERDASASGHLSVVVEPVGKLAVQPWTIVEIREANKLN